MPPEWRRRRGAPPAPECQAQLCRCSDGKRIVLNFDADGAGVRAANRAIGEVEQLALQGQLELRVFVRKGEHPDAKKAFDLVHVGGELEHVSTTGPGEGNIVLVEPLLYSGVGSLGAFETELFQALPCKVLAVLGAHGVRYGFEQLVELRCLSGRQREMQLELLLCWWRGGGLPAMKVVVNRIGTQNT